VPLWGTLLPGSHVSRFAGLVACAVVLTASGAGGLVAQEAAPAGRLPDPVREALRLRNQGDFAPAARLLEARIAREPADADARRLLAQTLYWLGERDSARATYEEALSRHPDDIELRLEYGRMLVETRHDRRAREVLVPVAAEPAGAAGAETLLGTSAYWSGDYTRAAGHFRRAVQADSSAQEARRQWREIAAVTAPWIRVGSAGRHDDQPLDRVNPELEAGLFLSPLWSIRARGEAAWYRPDPDPRRSVLTAAATASGYIPSLRLDAEASGGIVRRRVPTASATGIGSLALRLRLPGHVSLRARGERKPYFFTRASLTTEVMVNEGAVTLALQHPAGWLGEGSYIRQRFSDRNSIESAYAWLLAPIARSRAVTLQAGYAINAQHARESRFVLADTAQTVPPGHPLFDLGGAYVPYYTPDHLLAHSALAALELRTGAGGRFRIDATRALHARDDAPVFQVTGAPPAVVASTIRRAFTPWQVRGGLEQRVAPGLTLSVSGEHARTVFYSTSGGSVSLMYRFAAAAVRKVDRF
jgi:Tfp pilus assembly protein PilF